MALKIEVTCSNHQKDDGGYGRDTEIFVDTLDNETRDEVVQALAAQGWIVQFNGDHMDTYCSRKCAE